MTIGIDIGGTNIEVGWIESNGTIVKTKAYKTANFPEPEHLVEFIGNEILEQNKSFKKGQISALGIGAPNGNFYNGTIEFAPNLNWDGVIPLAKMFEKKIGLPTKLTNDANAAAYAEMLYGGAKNMSEFVVVTLGTGLGTGIVVNGKMLYGHTGFGGEFGHTIVFPEGGRACGCGRSGCLETYVSATAIVKTAYELLDSSSQKSSLREIKNIHSKDIFQAAKMGDDIALEAMRFTGSILGKQLADYVSLFSPEAIFLTGGLAKAYSILIPYIEKSLNENMLKIFKGSVKILPSSLIDKNAGMLGAAALVL